MERIRVFVVDDEPLARAGVCALLREDAELDVVGEAAGIDDAVSGIHELKPDLVMLDVQLAGATGFDVIQRIGAERMPAVVFITAFGEFAVSAFEVNAVDYLTKPFDDERFAITIYRAKKVIRQSRVGELGLRIADLIGGLPPGRPSTAPPPPRFPDRIVVKSSGRTIFLKTEEIDWIEAADYYVKIHSGKDAHLMRESMAALEARLDPARFFRVHRSAIVNLDRIRELQPYFQGETVLILQDGTKLKLSKARREKLEEILNTRL